MGNYYDDKIPKLNMDDIKNSLLNDSWLTNQELDRYRPYNDDEFDKLIKKLALNKSNIELKTKLFNSLIWYAAYVAMYAKKKFYGFTDDYQYYLSFAMERLWDQLDAYNPNDPSGASFYTKYLSDFRFRIKTQVEEDFLCTVYTRSVRHRCENAITKLNYNGVKVSEIDKIDNDAFRKIYKVAKHTFISYINNSINVSGNTLVTDDGEVELFDMVPYYVDEENVSVGKLTIEQIFSLAENDKSISEKNFNVWKEYVNDGYFGQTYDRVGRKFGITRERVRQIINKVDLILSHKHAISTMISA